MRALVASLFVAGAVASAVPARADGTELRIATLAPAGSTWSKLLAKGSAAIEEKTNKAITLKWYEGGSQGDERDFVRKIGLGQLDGAAVTAVGLSMIDESIRVLELPRMFKSVDEMDYVAGKMWPIFQKKFEKAGYKLVDRGEIGWVYFYSKDKIDSMSALKSAKLWLWGDDHIVKATYAKLGLTGVPLGVPEVDAALTAGRINACYTSPLAAVALQWSTKVGYRSEMAMSYGIAATVVSKKAFDALPAADQKTLLTLMEKTGRDIRKAVRKDNDDATKQMERKGVKVVPTPAAMQADFDKAAQEVWKDLVGKVYTQEDLDKVLKFRDEYRAKHP
jgi:TRAP-type C4-dicarboxylate transport system substrate-binding protein